MAWMYTYETIIITFTQLYYDYLIKVQEQDKIVLLSGGWPLYVKLSEVVLPCVHSDMLFAHQCQLTHQL